MNEKPLNWVGDSLERVVTFPPMIKRETGFQLRQIQNGLEPENWKPMKTIGVGVNEIRLKDKDGIYRVIYIAKLQDAVYVLHAFQKKTEKTSKQDIDIAKKRLKEIINYKKGV